ncbi:MAG: V-type ATP synthase subunit D [Candidatus Omnitrophica bacterium]|jgi:V/A-type H+-transporting ATPase subunit D|nr:V-type ATP synthase subunit D [Candidatus Omnitrophota bacterium]MDD3987606.1 V-type ATP synthase subunit D [Candidatus Omnitrophota bacterium]MDD4981362.1 V-type ATP synthase subunit D [Candidatus Omnitrophota bacterium]MDD5664778.1 V-type ATP synthase subunit D [Candidatus Omnitrophota bacterium]
MGKIKFTKGELKRQRDSLKQYERYLPTLQLKKQQLQLEILHQLSLLDEKSRILDKKIQQAQTWAGLLSEEAVDIKPLLAVNEIKSRLLNIAGVDIPIFIEASFLPADYDLFSAPLWLDLGVEALRGILALQSEVDIIAEGISILRHELKVTAQRVNLFEKVKIPETEENIRLIKIYIGDQMANAVGRSKIAKRKIEELVLEESLA